MSLGRTRDEPYDANPRASRMSRRTAWVTLDRTAAPNIATLVLEALGVRTFPGYPGHLVTVTAYEPDPANPLHWTESVLLQERRARRTSANAASMDLALDLAGSGPTRSRERQGPGRHRGGCRCLR